MFVEIKENLATESGPYAAGHTYELPDETAQSFIRANHAMPAAGPEIKCKNIRAAMRQLIANAAHQQSIAMMEKNLARLTANVKARVDNASGEKVLFEPFIGEVGWLVMWHLRLVHFSAAKHKIVCCRPGQQCLYPSASELCYDWKDPIPDSHRVGTDRIDRDWPDLAARFPDAKPVPTGGLAMDEELIPVCIDQKIPIKPRFKRGLKVDVCIGVRQRDFLPAKNYRGWPMIAAALHKKGYTFAIIGSRQSSYPLEGMACMSGDYGDWDSAIELLQNCRVFAGTDSGGAHLASVANGCPMIVQQVPNLAAGTTRCFIPRMADTTSYQVTQIGPKHWDEPEVMLDHILRSLEG